ncbi:MAG TPA: DUF4013 domain-containing protein [Anaerolineales bacterium]|nr:DUF4013 domain-containing protein [Anaerolineales bacterium]
MTLTSSASLSDLFVFPFRSKDWALKLLIGAAMSVLGALFLFIPALFVLGYLARLMRRIIGGGAPELPEWADWGELFISGLKAGAAVLIYSIPALLFFGVGYAALLAPAMVPFFEQSSQAEALAMLMLGGSFAGLWLMGASMLVWLATAILAPVAITHLIARDSFAAAFHVREWWRVLRANLGGFLVAFIFMLGLMMLLYMVLNVIFLTIIFCFLAPLVMAVLSVYQLLVGGALYADAYREAVSRLAAAPVTLAEALPAAQTAGE